MKNSSYSNGQIMDILSQATAGVAIPDLCWEYDMISAAFYK